MSLLTVENLGISVGDTPVVDGVSFTVEAGERVGLIGESGCGKSLTALALMGLLPEGVTAQGSVRLTGAELLNVPEKRLCDVRGEQLAMVFQEPMTALNPVMRVGNQVAEVLRLHRGYSRRVAMGHAADMFARVELPDSTDKLKAYPHQLSGGQRQRVMLAMALACGPDLLIADEPTTALDVTVQARMLGLLDRLVTEEGMALLFITHDLPVVASVCRRVAVMYGGRLVEMGTSKEVFSAPRHPYTAGLLSASLGQSEVEDVPPGGHLPTIPGSVPGIGMFPSGCVFRDRCPSATPQCEQAPVLSGQDRAFACWHPCGEASTQALEPVSKP